MEVQITIENTLMVCKVHIFFLSGILKYIRDRNKRFAYSRTNSQIVLTFLLNVKGNSLLTSSTSLLQL
jgi:hypothetical protein